MSPRPAEPETSPFKRPMLAKCTACTHVWPLVWLPMDASTAGRIMKAAAGGCCPACGNTRQSSIVMAGEGDAQAWSARHPLMMKEVRL